MKLPESKDLLNDPYYLNVERRLTAISLYSGTGILILCLAFGSVRFAGSFLVGATLSFYNFKWMKQGIDRVLLNFQPQVEQMAQRSYFKRDNRRVIFKYFLRYALIGVVLYAIVRFRFLDVKAAFLGLFLFVIAVIYECIYQVVNSLFEDWKGGRT
jgi:ATP synthase I chain